MAQQEQLLRVSDTLFELVPAARKSRMQAIKRDEEAFMGPLRRILMPAQRHGVRWLSASFDLGCSSILGDEMGMGKTAQTIVTLMRLRSQGVRGPFMIAVPPAVLINWQAEFKLWADALALPRFRVVVSHSSHPSQQEADPGFERRLVDAAYADVGGLAAVPPALQLRIRAMKAFTELMQAPEGAVLLTTHTTMACDAKVLRALPEVAQCPRWRLMIIDEAHLARNSKSRLFTSAMGLDPECYLLLTGTIIHNNLHEELQTLLQFVMPRSLRGMNLLKGMRHVQKPADLFDADGQPKPEPQQLQRILYAFTLRRVMAQYRAQFRMPMCKQVTVRLPNTPAQRACYVRLHALRKLRDADAERLQLAITAYQQQTDRHPLIVSSSTMKGLKPAGLPPNPLESKVKKAQRDEYMLACAEGSQKIAFLLAALRTLHSVPGHRVLVFSQATRALTLIAAVLRLAGYTVDMITGDMTNMLERTSRVDRFNLGMPKVDGQDDCAGDSDEEPPLILPSRLEEHARGGAEPGAEAQDALLKELLQHRASPSARPTVMLLSTMAMGMGVNIPGADTVIFYDSHCNPQNDAQALARAYRKGQTRPVLVLRLITKGSTEAKMLDDIIRDKLRMQHWLEVAVLAGRDARLPPPPEPPAPFCLGTPEQLETLLLRREGWRASSSDECYAWGACPAENRMWPEAASMARA